MKFSIITPFFNETPEMIERVCSSVLAQTYGNFEWIITDDFSGNEELHKLVTSLPQRDNRIRYVEEKSKKEMWWNPQTYATGDVVVIIDGDDYTFPKTLECYNYFYNKYPDVFCMTTEIDYFRGGGYCGALYTNYENYKSHLHYCGGIPHDSSVVRHGSNSAFQGHGYNRSWRNIAGIDFKSGLDNRLIINDYIQLNTVELYGKLLHLYRPLYGYFEREESITRSITEHNNFGVKTDEANIMIDQKRGGRELNTIKRIFDQIFLESTALFNCNLSKEINTKKVAFITPYIMSLLKQEQLRELYFDHQIYFNEYIDDADYCVVLFTEYSQHSKFEEIYNNISKYIGKIPVNIQITYKTIKLPENNLLFEFRDFLVNRHTYTWFDFNNQYVTFKL